MSLLNRQNNTVPPELEPYYETDSSRRRRIIRGIIGILVIIIIIALLIWGCIALWRHFNNDTSKVKAPTTSQSKDSNDSSNSSDTGDTGSSNTPPASSGTNATNQGNTNTPSQSPNPTVASIPNAGPGDTIAIFAGITLAAAAAYQIVLRKKLAE